jgi:hypothetical protein
MYLAENRQEHVHTVGGTRPGYGQQCISRRMDKITYELRAEQSHEMVNNAFHKGQTKLRTSWGAEQGAVMVSTALSGEQTRSHTL